MNTRLWIWTCVLGVALAGCSGDDDSNDPTIDAGSEDASGGSAASGGMGGRGGRGGTGGTGGSGMMPAEPVECGSTTCTPPQNPLAALGGGAFPGPAACCLDEDEGICGIAPSVTAACEPLAVEDARCPSTSLGALEQFAGLLPGGALGGFGCCTADNQCGVDAALFGRGCVENAEARSMLQSIQLPLPISLDTIIMVPEPQACDALGEDGGVVDEDGGI